MAPGYTSNRVLAKTKDVQLPADNKKPTRFYFPAQLDHLKRHIRESKHYDARTNSYIVCMQCSANQKFEAECDDCGKMLPRGAYNKVQFKKDEPVCEKCHFKAMHEDEPPSGNDDGSDGDDTSSSGGNFSGDESEYAGTRAATSTRGPSSGTGGVHLNDGNDIHVTPDSDSD